MMCDKALAFNTEEEARSAMMSVPVRPTGQVPFRVYRCRECRKWHFTSKNEMKRRK